MKQEKLNVRELMEIRGGNEFEEEGEGCEKFQCATIAECLTKKTGSDEEEEFGGEEEGGEEEEEGGI